MSGATGVKDDKGKPQLSLLPREALEGAARVAEFGAKKYARDNWRGGMPWCRPADAVLRHVEAFIDGEEVDAESGEHPLDHALFTLMMLRWYTIHRPDLDNRFKGVAPAVEELNPEYVNDRPFNGLRVDRVAVDELDLKYPFGRTLTADEDQRRAAANMKIVDEAMPRILMDEATFDLSKIDPEVLRRHQPLETEMMLDAAARRMRDVQEQDRVRQELDDFKKTGLPPNPERGGWPIPRTVLPASEAPSDIVDVKTGEVRVKVYPPSAADRVHVTLGEPQKVPRPGRVFVVTNTAGPKAPCAGCFYSGTETGEEMCLTCGPDFSHFLAAKVEPAPVYPACTTCRHRFSGVVKSSPCVDCQEYSNWQGPAPEKE